MSDVQTNEPHTAWQPGGWVGPTPEPEAIQPAPPERPTPKPNKKGEIPAPLAAAQGPNGKWIARWRNWPNGTMSQRYVGSEDEAKQLAQEKFDEWVRQGQPMYAGPKKPAKGRPMGSPLLDLHGPLPVVEKNGLYSVTYRSLPSGNKSKRGFRSPTEAQRFASERWRAWKAAGQPTPKTYKSVAERAAEAPTPVTPKPEPKIVVPRAAEGPVLGSMVRVAGLFLDEDDVIRIMLRNDEDTWLVAIVGRTGEQ